MSFSLHPRLAADTAMIADWPLSRVLLMNDSRFPWLILVPRRDGLLDLADLDAETRGVLMGEIGRAATRLKEWAKAHGGCERINMGAIGNIVPQLHVHVVARAPGDSAWPGVVWGSGQNLPYGEEALQALVRDFRGFL
jgi:diadenosine tetraphosphate (Ap4A) HIT family hydrolase